jgi:ribosome-associated protein
MKPRKDLSRKDEILRLVCEAASDKKAEDVVTLDLKRETGIADHFVVCTGDNQHHTRAIRDAIVDALAGRGVSPWHSEGERDGRWILIDFSDIVVHIMTPQVRSYYGIEELWEEMGKKAPRSAPNA